MDILQEKWYGGLPCFKLVIEIAQPRPLGVTAVTGVFILLGVGMALGLLILFVEHLFFRYTLPILRDKPKGSVWRSRNIMFFSQVSFRCSHNRKMWNELWFENQRNELDREERRRWFFITVFSVRVLDIFEVLSSQQTSVF